MEELFNYLLELLKLLIPAFVVYLTVKSMFQKYNEHQVILQRGKQKEKFSEGLFPFKLQAYERMMLFLERISPDQQLRRIVQTGMTNGELQAHLLTAIRNEYEHNLSQQIYMSEDTWEVIKQVKNQLVHKINANAQSLQADGSALELSTALLSDEALTQILGLGKTAIKTEISELFE